MVGGCAGARFRALWLGVSGVQRTVASVINRARYQGLPRLFDAWVLVLAAAVLCIVGAVR